MRLRRRGTDLTILTICHYCTFLNERENFRDAHRRGCNLDKIWYHNRIIERVERSGARIKERSICVEMFFQPCRIWYSQPWISFEIFRPSCCDVRWTTGDPSFRLDFPTQTSKRITLTTSVLRSLHHRRNKYHLSCTNKMEITEY